MKVLKVIQNIIKKATPTEHVMQQSTSCPITYNPKNVTEKEFREYIHWLAKNKINRTVQEPDRFITEAERKTLEKKKSELEKYKNFVKYLAENNINRTFIC